MSCKLDRIADEYGLTSIDDELRGAKADGASLRDLETLVNHRLLKQAFLDAGSPLLPGEVDTLYELLTDAEVSGEPRSNSATGSKPKGSTPTHWWPIS